MKHRTNLKTVTAIRVFNCSPLIYLLVELHNGNCKSGWRVWGGPSEDPWPARWWAPEATGPRVTTSDSKINLLYIFLILTLCWLVSFKAYSNEVEPPKDYEDKEEVFFTRDRALRENFPEAAEFKTDLRKIEKEVQQSIDKLGIGPLEEPPPHFQKAYNVKGDLLGYGVVVEQIGKYRPITIFVALSPNLQVKDTAIMIYRESRGGEVSRKRFLHQYQGKTLKDPIRLHKDIINISGSTLSAQAVSVAVKRALFLANQFYGQKNSFESQMKDKKK